VYRDVAPWDIDGVQPDMAALLAELPPKGPVLDLGCGSGDLSLHLARSGLEVLGIDFVDAAIEQARQKLRARSPEMAAAVEFRVADALRPSLLRRSFGSVVDSGFYHLFAPEQCDRLADEIASVLVTGGRLYLHEFAVEFPVPNTPRAVSEDEVRARFTPERGWEVLQVRAVQFLNRIAPVPATIACIQRLGPPGL
jgi:cyclopropane fatty-acyl-phospholipid synthase-like methyltransferase